MLRDWPSIQAASSKSAGGEAQTKLEVKTMAKVARRPGTDPRASICLERFMTNPPVIDMFVLGPLTPKKRDEFGRLSEAPPKFVKQGNERNGGGKNFSRFFAVSSVLLS